MTQKKNEVQAAAAPTSLNEKLADFPLQKEYFERLTSKINQRAALQSHLEKIKTRRESADFDGLIEDPENLDRDNLGKISLYFENNRHSSYDIVNPTLLKDVADFIQSKLENRISQVEGEISAMK